MSTAKDGAALMDVAMKEFLVSIWECHYNYILHYNLNPTLEKTSVSMMVLLVSASLIGISSMYQYVEGQTPPPKSSSLLQVVYQGLQSMLLLMAKSALHRWTS